MVLRLRRASVSALGAQVHVEALPIPLTAMLWQQGSEARATYEALVPLKTHASAGGHAGRRTILVREFSHHRFSSDEQTSDRCRAL
jgi:hypothetical protein